MPPRPSFEGIRPDPDTLLCRVDYYAESKKRVRLFEETLERFCKTLEKHDLAKKMDITLKKPNEYNLTDVIRIADKVYEKHKTAADVQSCTGKIRKCFRLVGKNASPLQCLLKFVPSDTYGSVISGGFTVILAVSQVPISFNKCGIDKCFRLPNESSPFVRVYTQPSRLYPRNSGSSEP